MDPTAPKDKEQPKKTPETQQLAQQPQQQKPAQQAKPETPMQELQELEIEVSKRFRDHKLFFPFIIIVIILLSWAIFALLVPQKDTKTKTSIITPTPTIKKIALPTPSAKQKSQTFVYGTWTSQSTVIRAIDLSSNNIKTLATLPLTVKKISVLSPDSLLYIDQTNSNDNGQRISVYNIIQKQITTNIPAANGFAIDNYVLSPNKRYLAMWEVKFSPDTHTLTNGESRVYVVDLTRPTIVNLLYDEEVTQNVHGVIETVPVHYPVAVQSNGTIFTDQYLANDPNGGTGWAYGMTKIDYDGTNQQDVTSMTNGTYASQPSLSPDGKFLLFTGYDGSHGSGTKITGSYRQALLTPDTVELLDTETLKRYVLPNLPNTNIYSDVQWDSQTANVIISVLSPDIKQMGIYIYDLGALHMTQIPLPEANNTPYSFISQLNDTQTLIGIQSTDPSNLGNLGDTYTYAYTQLAILGEQNKLSYISVEDPFIQYITLVPGNYFTKVLGFSTSPQTTLEPTISYISPSPDTNPQNYDFFLKTTLAGIRTQGKTNPPSDPNMCQDLGFARCSVLGFTQDSTGFAICQKIERSNNRTESACY